jgi:hypothetical protein
MALYKVILCNGRIGCAVLNGVEVEMIHKNVYGEHKIRLMDGSVVDVGSINCIERQPINIR